MKYRIDFEMLLFVFKAVHDLAPQGITDTILPQIKTEIQFKDGSLIMAKGNQQIKAGPQYTRDSQGKK